MSEPAPAPAAPSPLERLHPAYFAMAMATGIVSLAAHALGLRAAALGLFWLNCALYAGLWGATLLRCARHLPAVRADLLHHGRSVGFFTVVPATCVLGSQWLLIAGAWRVAFGLWLAGAALLFLLTYAIMTVLTVRAPKPTLAEGLNGGWLLAVVAAQSCSVLGAQLAPGLGPWAPHVYFFSLAAWLAGGMLYIWIISLIFYRYLFFPLEPSDLSPPYWVNMGAVAISTLAGSQLAAAGESWPLLRELAPFVKGLTLLFWATASWWIPMLVTLGVWRHVIRRFPLRYDPLYWGAVFPLGMYTLATHRLAGALEVPFLLPIPQVALWVALAAWGATFLGFLGALPATLRGLRGR